MSDFFIDVIEVVKLIPKGRVTTYGRIAKYLGSVKSSRSVGWALNNIKLDDTIPAHRVVNRNGLLTGRSHFPKPDFMKNKLMAEGVLIDDNCIVNLNKYIWDPIKDLTL
jgi:methylated-DNA-protein-cysteine methyltransferase-like protein